MYPQPAARDFLKVYAANKDYRETFQLTHYVRARPRPAPTCPPTPRRFRERHMTAGQHTC